MIYASFHGLPCLICSGYNNKLSEKETIVTMKREVLSEKLMVIGVDGLDPKLTLKYMAEGIMPNTKKLIEAGACREDLIMLGGHPNGSISGV